MQKAKKLHRSTWFEMWCAKVCDVIKNRLQHKYSRSFRGSFFENKIGSCFWIKFSIRKEFLKEKAEGEIAFALINLPQVQIQDPASGSTTTKEFVFLEKFAEFYYHKILEARSRWRLKHFRVWRNPCDLSVTGDIKIFQFHVIKR